MGFFCCFQTTQKHGLKEKQEFGMGKATHKIKDSKF